MKYLKVIDKKKACISQKKMIPSVHEEEALVKIRFITLCGSDFKHFEGNYPGPSRYPIIIGHEWSGEIVKIKSRRSQLKQGDHVTGDCSKWGAGCSFSTNCLRDKNVCTRVEKYGITIDGVAQEYVRMPVRYLYKAPSNLPLSVLALAEVFSVSLNSIKKVENSLGISSICLNQKKESNILIIGAGAVGIAIYLLLKYKYKNKNILLFEASIEKMKSVARLFPEMVFFPEPKNSRYSRKNNYTEVYNNTFFSTIFEATGSEQAVRNAFQWVNVGGSIVLSGMYKPIEAPLGLLILKNANVVGSLGGTGSFNEVIDFFARYHKFVQKMVTNVYKINLSNIREIFKRNNEDIKVQLSWD